LRSFGLILLPAMLTFAAGASAFFKSTFAPPCSRNAGYPRSLRAHLALQCHR
jgi:hypothetical protein